MLDIYVEGVEGVAYETWEFAGVVFGKFEVMLRDVQGKVWAFYLQPVDVQRLLWKLKGAYDSYKAKLAQRLQQPPSLN